MRNLDTPLVCNNEETPADDNKERILGCRAIVQCTARDRCEALRAITLQPAF